MWFSLTALLFVTCLAPIWAPISMWFSWRWEWGDKQGWCYWLDWCSDTQPHLHLHLHHHLVFNCLKSIIVLQYHVTKNIDKTVLKQDVFVSRVHVSFEFCSSCVRAVSETMQPEISARLPDCTCQLCLSVPDVVFLISDKKWGRGRTRLQVQSSHSQQCQGSQMWMAPAVIT